MLLKSGDDDTVGLNALACSEEWVQSTELRSCVKVEVDVLGSPSLVLVIILMVSVDVKQHRANRTASGLRSCVKVEVAVLVDGWLKCCFTSTETVGLLGTGAQDVHLDHHTAHEL